MEATELSLPFQLRQGQGLPLDWSHLPSDLLVTISKKLHDLFDFTYFRAVCKKWRTATSISDLPRQMPWLLEARIGVDSIHTEDLRFYSLISGRTRTIHCPNSRGLYLFGPSHGYLYATNFDFRNPKHSLLNPLTRDEVIIEFERYHQPFMVCMGPDPMGSADHMAFMDDCCSQTMGFYQPRNWDWDYVELPVRDLNLRHACLQGMYFINEIETGNTVVVHIPCGSSFSIPPPENLHSYNNVYFVESAGKILRIVKRLDLGLAASNSNFSFNIYQFDVGDENLEYRWVKTSSIGSEMLFLDFRTGFSITAAESTGLRGNCIYYIQSHYDGIVELSSEVYKYDIEDGRTEKIASPFNKRGSWFVPHAAGRLPTNCY